MSTREFDRFIVFTGWMKMVDLVKDGNLQRLATTPFADWTEQDQRLAHASINGITGLILYGLINPDNMNDLLKIIRASMLNDPEEDPDDPRNR